MILAPALAVPSGVIPNADEERHAYIKTPWVWLQVSFTRSSLLFRRSGVQHSIQYVDLNRGSTPIR